MNAEQSRLEEARTHKAPWKLWGPYLSERQWGTVREDYSENGDAWNYFTHDQARSRAYRWGEDGLAGICDDRQRLCFALALWNGHDPILKERLFGLTNAEGNHGEDVKEYYFYLDSTPTHSYMQYLYKYPQAAYPYDDLVRTNRARGVATAGIRAARHRRVRRRPLLRRVRRVRQRRPRRYPDPLHRLQPRSGRGDPAPSADAVVSQHMVLATARSGPSLAQVAGAPGQGASSGPSTRGWAIRYLYCDGGRPAALHRERDQHAAAFGVANHSAYVKDGIDDFVVHGARRGQPGADRHQGRGPLPLDHRPGECRVVRVRLSD